MAIDGYAQAIAIDRLDRCLAKCAAQDMDYPPGAGECVQSVIEECMCPCIRCEECVCTAIETVIRTGHEPGGADIFHVQECRGR